MYIWIIMIGFEWECFLFIYINIRKSGYNLWRRYSFGCKINYFMNFS